MVDGMLDIPRSDELANLRRAVCRPTHVMNRSTVMESATFRKWLAEQGCRFDRQEHHKRGEGHVMVTVHREGRTSQAPLGGSGKDLDPRDLRRVCEELGLDWSELPGLKSRV
jgi:hypothetical protein